ncbi:MAG: universal stress protein [Planctomycetota bacterium]|nr:universal stress protein [Planctomycetota bacterium]
MANQTPRNITKILAATGLTPESVGGLVMARDLASRTGASLHVVHVIEPMSAVEEKAIPGLSAQHVQQAEEELRLFCASHGVPETAEQHVVRGDPSGEILRLRAALKADLLVMGRYGKGGLKRGRLGSIANSVVRKCQVSVLIAHPEFRGEPKRVGVACDFHEPGQLEIRRALRLGKMFGAEEIVVLAAYDVPAGYHTVMSWEDACAGLESAFRDVAERELAQAEAAEPGSPGWRLRLEEGSPASRIPAMAQEEHLDVLVLGTHTRSRAAMALLGRTSEKIIDAAGCTVWAERDAGTFQGFLEALKEWAE